MDNLKINYKSAMTWVNWLAFVVALGALGVLLWLGLNLIVNITAKDFSPTQVMLNGIALIFLFLVIGLYGYLVFDFLKARLNMLQSQWQEEFAYEERQKLKAPITTSNTTLKKIKEKYKLLNELLPNTNANNTTTEADALEQLKNVLNKKSLPDLTAIQNDQQEEFLSFKMKFDLLNELKPGDKADQEYKNAHQLATDMVNKEFNSFALQHLNSK